MDFYGYKNIITCHAIFDLHSYKAFYKNIIVRMHINKGASLDLAKRRIAPLKNSLSLKCCPKSSNVLSKWFSKVLSYIKTAEL